MEDEYQQTLLKGKYLYYQNMRCLKQRLEEEKKNEHHNKSIKYYYHHSVGAIARSLYEVFKGRGVAGLVVTGVIDRDFELNGASFFHPVVRMNIPQVQYEGVTIPELGGERFMGEFPLGELNPEDYTIDEINREEKGNEKE
jgi:hypothetical protein